MSIIREWAAAHAVPLHLILDLEARLGLDVRLEPVAAGGTPGSEAQIQAEVRIAAAQAGWHLFRNNVGACADESGRLIRYGLANESKRVNEQVKSGDLIGWRPVVITLDHIGLTLAQFVSIECKAGNWRYTGTPREKAQLAWINLCTVEGAYAKFINNARML